MRRYRLNGLPPGTAEYRPACLADRKLRFLFLPEISFQFQNAFSAKRRSFPLNQKLFPDRQPVPVHIQRTIFQRYRTGN